MRRHHNNSGFTLIEILTAVQISILLFASVLGMFVVVNRFYATNMMGQNLQRDADLTITKIIKGKVEPGGVFRLSEAVSFEQISISELHFVGTDGNERWYKLSADGGSVVYHHFIANGTVDETVYTAPQGAVLTLRFWIPAGTNYAGLNVGVDVGISQVKYGKTFTGSSSTLVNIRNHPS